ncbi:MULTISPECIES: type II toxin-antitoxin system RelE/ParE family toxin [unclassified Roseateles]|uniref:type II toxin-antitoxin system RelE/ParE family toxin n=1 Tax=unclassified Roseateles TaxID=2626991 RepID=UPI0006FCF4E2|nr:MULTISPECIES: type II toxin-antitoxin system RelE/ParE family toxin [unclassified Roseateles]KQW41224.1 plasmid stabilization protein [Pelomonas sp. Root405]KRA67996.1 plasmid stabilization protein [Pelomonas sp. Root662]
MRVVFLPGAEQDLRDIRRYVLKKFGPPAWADTLARLRATVDALNTFPLSGAVPEELADLGSERYRQLVSGKNRVIYEPTAEVVYIHIVCDARRDLRGLLARRLLGVAR